VLWFWLQLTSKDPMRLPLKNNDFKQYTQMEQLRGIETEAEKDDQNTPLIIFSLFDTKQYCTNFQQWLFYRLKTFQKTPQAQDWLAAGPTSFCYFRWSLVFAGVLLGFLSSSGLVTADQQQVNIFWLLSALLGTNAVTLVLWVVVITAGGANQGILAGGIEWLLRKVYTLPKRPSRRQISRKFWWMVQLSKPLQTWQIAVFIHSFWLSLLIGSLLALLLVFATQ